MLKLSLFILLFAVVHCNNKGNGYGERYEWHNSLAEGLQVSRSTGKPAMVIIHQSWCPRCKELKPKFAASTDILALSKKFVMINCLDDEEPEDEDYAPDGKYYQRLIFVSPTRGVMKEIYNEGGLPEYRHYYVETEDIVKSMKKVLRSLGKRRRR